MRPEQSPDQRIVASAIRECLAARNGHGRRWARERCARQLAGDAEPSKIDRMCAQAAAEIAEVIRHAS